LRDRRRKKERQSSGLRPEQKGKAA
jgi:hypothetical protein